MKNPLYRSNSYFFRSKFGEIHPTNPQKKEKRKKKNPILTRPGANPPKNGLFFSGMEIWGGVREEECGGKERDLTGKIVRRATNHHFNCLITFA
jgi:hypothetical protein